MFFPPTLIEIVPPIRILHLEDNFFDTELIRNLLEADGMTCDIVCATSREQFAEALEKAAFDLIICDFNIPGYDGISALKLTQETHPETPVIIVSGSLSEEEVVKCLHLGATDYLIKQRLERLPSAVRRALQEAEGHYRRRQTEATLHDSEERFRQLAEQSDQGFWFVAEEPCRILYVSPAIEKMWGMPAKWFYQNAREWLEAIHPDDREHVRQSFDAALAGTADRFEAEFRIVRPDGSVCRVVDSGTPIRDAAGDFVRMGGVVKDVTERRQAEEALLQSQKMEAVWQLTGGIAHDFNNILAVILAFAAFARDKLPEGDARRDDITEVLLAADRGVALTRQLLTFSRQSPVAKQPIDINVSLEGLLSMLRRSVGENIVVDVTPSSRPAIVRMDPVQFDQVLLNMAVNARDAMPAGGYLRIAVSQSEQGAAAGGRYVRVVVRDTGAGMDPATMARIFEPFFTTKDVGKGTGLGLATSYAIVKDASGTIRVASDPEHGTTFTIDLPVCAEPVAGGLANEPVIPRAAGQRVLVVEDDAALRKAALQILESAGYRVIQARDGDEAIRLLDEVGSDLELIVSDVVMPGRGGYAVAAHAKKHNVNARVLLTSGYLAGQAVDAGDTGDLSLLWKPYTQTSLLRAAHNILNVERQSTPHASVPALVDALVSSVTLGAVLIIEDDLRILAAFRRLLVGAGYEVVTASSIATAKEALTPEHDYAAILCDLTLPDGSGAHLVRWLREVRPALARRVLILTGGAIDEAGRKLVGEGITEVLEKPIDAARLLERVAWTVNHEAAPAATHVEPGSLAPGSGSVLLVDDDDAQRHAYGRILRLSGYTVSAARSGEEAMDLLARFPFDAVATDIGLPGMDGMAILRAVRARDADMPVLLITGAPSVETATTAVSGRAAGYLAKPFLPAQLVSEIGRAVESGQVARLQRKLLASHAGADAFLLDIPATQRAFEAALKNLRMVFQPIVRSRDGSIYAYEALLRSAEPMFVTPPKLLAAAEVLGRTDEVGRAVRACVALALEQHPERSELIFVNLHPSELRSELLCDALEPLRRSAGRVVLEVTERASLSMGPHLTDEVRLLREAGYRIAIDDLGAGYAGLSCLVQLRPDIAKIDMSIVQGAPQSLLKREILESLIYVCRRANILVVAEGVETEDEAQLLTDLKCDFLQGYFFAKPAPPFPEAGRLLPIAG